MQLTRPTFHLNTQSGACMRTQKIPLCLPRVKLANYNVFIETACKKVFQYHLMYGHKY